MIIEKKAGDRALKRAWWLLISLTLVSAFVAESANPAIWVILAVSYTIVCKGQVIIDQLMGLRNAPVPIRLMMLSYFYILPPLIALALLFPESLAQLTTL